MKAMTTAEIVGDIVQVVLTDARGLEPIGVTTGSPFLKVIGMDDLGLWVEHPQYILMKTNDARDAPCRKISG